MHQISKVMDEDDLDMLASHLLGISNSIGLENLAL